MAAKGKHPYSGNNYCCGIHNYPSAQTLTGEGSDGASSMSALSGTCDISTIQLAKNKINNITDKNSLFSLILKTDFDL